MVVDCVPAPRNTLHGIVSLDPVYSKTPHIKCQNPAREQGSHKFMCPPAKLPHFLKHLSPDNSFLRREPRSLKQFNSDRTLVFIKCLQFPLVFSRGENPRGGKWLPQSHSAPTRPSIHRCLLPHCILGTSKSQINIWILSLCPLLVSALMFPPGTPQSHILFIWD